MGVYARYVIGTESPDSFHAWSLITVVGYLMGRKCWIMPGNDRSIQYPRLYTVLVAPPGAARKSVALDTAVEFVREMKLPIGSNSITKEALIVLCAEHETEELVITGRDADGNEEATLVKRNDVLMAASEFSTFLRERGMNSGLVMMLNAWYDCPRNYEDRTITRGINSVAGVFMPILAATTAHALAQSLSQGDIEGGIASRMLFVVETTSKGRIPYQPMTPDQISARAEVARRLREIHEFFRGRMTFTLEAWAFYQAWYTGERYDKGIAHPRLVHYLSRKQSHFFSAAMICQALLGLSMVIGLDAVQLAVLLLESIEPNMHLAFAGVGSDSKNPAMQFGARFVAYISRFPSGIGIKDLFLAFSGEITFDQCQEAVEHLKAAKQIVSSGGKIKAVAHAKAAQQTIMKAED